MPTPVPDLSALPVDLLAGIALSLVGWYLAARLGFPAPAILGPMILVGAVSSFGWLHLSFPTWFKTALQIIVGSYLGYRIDRTAVARIVGMLKPVALMTAWMISAAIFIGFLFSRVTGVDAATSFLGTSPAGIAEMSATAMSLQADVTLVATLQALRIIGSLLSIPLLARGAYKRRGSAPHPAPAPTSAGSGVPPLGLVNSNPFPAGMAGITPLMYLVIGALGGYLLLAINFPAAGIIGSLVAVCLTRVGGMDLGAPPQVLRILAQVGLGLVVGVSFNEQTIVELQSDLIPILVVTAATVGSGILLAEIVRRRLGTDLQTALLACAPGGVIQMTVIADELGGDAVMVNVVQLARLVTTIVLFPIFVRFVAGG